MASCSSVLIVSERGRYCSNGVLSFRRMRVNLPVEASLESSQIPAQLHVFLASAHHGRSLDDEKPSRNVLTESDVATIALRRGALEASGSRARCSGRRVGGCRRKVPHCARWP
jgi:hypothetical protein